MFSSVTVPAVSFLSYTSPNESQSRCVATTAPVSGPVYSATAVFRWPALVAQSELVFAAAYCTSGLAASVWLASHRHVPGWPHSARMRFR